jgi:predicted Zn-dependent peptidase
MKTIRIYGINEKMFYEKLPNGLDVYLFPMAKRNQTAVTLATRFGAKDTEFTPYNKKKMIKMPEGIAHFLEHRLCTDKNGQNAFDFYAKSGSEFNADTSACKTRFYFTCTKNLTLNLLFLLDMIQDPCFKTEDIEREKSIIEQEIKNDADKPYTNLYREGMRNVFCYHSVRNSILGTFDDIKGITKKCLRTAMIRSTNLQTCF